MLRQVFAATAAVVLLAGCSGGDDQPSADQSQDGTQPSGTPTTAAPTPYDPPKAFEAVAATGLAEEKGHSSYEPKAGMVGTTAVANSLSGALGRSVTGEGHAWRTPSSDPAGGGTTETNDATAPHAVQVDGKPAVAVAYYQRVKGTGTTKPVVQVLFRWLDPSDGKPVSEATVDVTPTIGEQELDTGLPGLLATETVDPATGQMAVGLAPASLIGAKSGIFTVYADPATKKGSTVPWLEPAGVVNGVVAGAMGKDATRRTLALADGATGKVTKSGLLPGLEGLGPAGSGMKHAYLYGQKYNKGTSEYEGNIYAVDPATGTVVTTRSAVKETRYLIDYSCWGDRQKSVVCTADPEATRETEVIGFDDTTGKKTWGYTEQSGGRVVPVVSAAFHGLVYGTVETKRVLLDALTGRDVPMPTPTATPGGSPTVTASPTDGSPTDGSSPTDATTPTDGSSPTETPTDGITPVPVDLEPKSPAAVSEYGGAYVREADGLTDGLAGSLQVLKAVG